MIPRVEVLLVPRDILKIPINVDICVLGEMPRKTSLTVYEQAEHQRGLCLSVLLFHGIHNTVK